MLKWLKRILGGPPAPEPQARPRTFAYSSVIPEALGIRPELEGDAHGLVRKLEEALQGPYLPQVRERVKFRHPEIGDAKYGWMEMEMKRFFLLAAVLRHVPMYSDDADLIWHEMLMFTREYQQFCDRFAGFYIHHQPNVRTDEGDAAASESQWEDRAAFELVYSALFWVAPENHRLLGLFYRRKMPPALLEEIESGDPDRIRAALRFRNSADPAVAAVQEGILGALQDKSRQARAYHEESRPYERSSFYGGTDPLWTMMAFGMATDLSPFDPVLEESEKQRETSGSSCSVYTDGTSNSSCNSSNDNNGHKDSSDGGSCSSSDDGGSGSSSCSSSSCSSSSCSSSSCGSSCGGGGN
ncbi:hypothetical protein GE107_25140 [Cohnella sp. CFH 77786]|uniref:hypothetical protein n=1 Tax=Cohnella sp. CFH 77786 TaxID=2662265 RepID=UPI001C60FA73|nr:hypothetical protein [Cohnella sp. CFH 77786]MBW5449316.1 hypothetical protein [Cohnella sp. CFH 77786]